jgi:hypothetical protein
MLFKNLKASKLGHTHYSHSSELWYRKDIWVIVCKCLGRPCMRSNYNILKQNEFYRFMTILYNAYSKYSTSLTLMWLNICSGNEISKPVWPEEVQRMFCAIRCTVHFRADQGVLSVFYLNIGYILTDQWACENEYSYLNVYTKEWQETATCPVVSRHS